MNTFQIQSLPLKDVITDYARSFRTTVTEKRNECCVEIPSKWGKGEIKGINLDGGLGLIHYACSFKDDLEVQFVVNNIHPLKFLYCLEGHFEHRFATSDEEHLMQQYENCIVASQLHNGHILIFDKNVFTEIFSVEIDRRIFKEKFEHIIKKSHPKLKHVLQDDTAERRFYHKGHYSLYLANLFQKIKEDEKDGFVQRLFLEGRVYEVVANQMNQYIDDTREDSNRHLLRTSEMKSILQAVEFIGLNLGDLPTVNKIAQHVGLNTNKLQDGFKQLHGLTVNAYIQKTKLENAKNLLLQTDFSVQEIMHKVGWNSKSYFSQLFKGTYRQTPTEFRSNHQKDS